MTQQNHANNFSSQRYLFIRKTFQHTCIQLFILNDADKYFKKYKRYEKNESMVSRGTNNNKSHHFFKWNDFFI